MTEKVKLTIEIPKIMYDDFRDTYYNLKGTHLDQGENLVDFISRVITENLDYVFIVNKDRLTLK